MDKITEAASVSEILRSFLRPQEKVLVWGMTEAGRLAAQAAVDLGGDVLHWNTQESWQGLLRQVFAKRVTVLIGPPKVILGLAKIARVTGTPLPVRHAVLLGQCGDDWLLKGIRDSLDARIHICDRDADGEPEDTLMGQLDEILLSWSSVLDYRAKRAEQGLCLEIVVFPGRQLPQLPSGASITVRPWCPGEDAPMMSW